MSKMNRIIVTGFGGRRPRVGFDLRENGGGVSFSLSLKNAVKLNDKLNVLLDDPEGDDRNAVPDVVDKTRWYVAIIDRRGMTCSSHVDGTAQDAHRWIQRKVEEAHNDTEGFNAMPAMASIVTVSGAHFTSYMIHPETGRITEVRNDD